MDIMELKAVDLTFLISVVFVNGFHSFITECKHKTIRYQNLKCESCQYNDLMKEIGARSD